MTSVDLLDWNVLERLCGHKQELVRRLAGEFVGDAEQELSHLQSAVAAQDAAHIKQLSHRLYGSARTVGAGRLAQAIKELESACLAGRTADFAALMTRVEQELQLVLSAITARNWA